MRLIKLELKRVLKTRMTILLLAAALVLSLLMAYIPITFSYVNYWDDNGNQVRLLGMDAIAYYKTAQAGTAGVVTPQKVRQAVERYQDCLAKYGAESTYDLPKDVYSRELLPDAPLRHGIREAFADPISGLGPSITELVPERIDEYYSACQLRLSSLMHLEDAGHPAAQKKAEELYSRVETPFQFYPGYSTDAMDYQLLLSYLVVLLCAVIAAPIFTSDYQTRADDILRCTKHGRLRLAAAKISSALLICGAAFLICAAAYLLVSNSLFGWECTKSSMQMLYSITSLPNLNIGGLQLACAGGYLLSLLATASFTLFLSSKIRNVVTTLSAALVSCILPFIVVIAVPAEIGKWIYTLFPASGVALQASFLYAFSDFVFWNIGNTAIWTPYVMVIACCVDIPLFLGLAVRSYCTHKV